MTKFAFLLLMSLLCLPVVANQEDEGVLTFAYAVEREGTAYDLFVMDARSGELLHSIVDEGNDCPYSLSENRNFLVFSQGAGSRRTSTGSLLEINTGAILSLGELKAADIFGNQDFSKIAYITQIDENFHRQLYVYEPSSGERYWIAEADDIEIMRFVGDDLLFVQLKRNEITFNRWNSNFLETQSFPRRESHNISLDISPDGNLLKVLYQSNHTSAILSRIDTVTGSTEDIVLPQLDIKYLPKWMPNSVGSFAYIGDDNNIWFFDSLTGELETILEYETTSLDGVHILASSFTNLVWSPDGSYLMVTQSFEIGATIRSIEMRTGIVRDAIPLGDVWDVQWLSATEFVYDFTEYGNYQREFDIFYYNASTGENRQLTNTDELNETLYCGWG